MELPFSSATAPSVVLPLAAAFALAILGALVLHFVQRFLRRRRAVYRIERAQDGERRAPVWLERLGYRVLGAQVACTYPVSLDGTRIDVALRADYLVEKDGLRYVAEVKTGAAAPRIQTPSTRRQLLEYRVAFDVDGVLLVDAESGRVHAVSFPLAERVSERAGRDTRSWEERPLLTFLAAAAFLATILALAHAHR